MRSLHTLLHGLIDYAGLFPPAALDLSTAAANYASYRTSEECWALGRFVIPAARLGELEVSAEASLPVVGAPWKITALAGPDLARDLANIAGFNQRQRGRAVADTIELKASTTAGISEALRTIDGRVDTFVELPLEQDPAPLIDTLALTHARAKVRTGGVTADAFPKPAHLLRFIRRCVDANVSFKATAGLHHPLRGAYRLTYQPASGCATMFGFLNVFLAPALLQQGVGDVDALELLEESSPANFQFDDDLIAWRSHRLGEAELRYARQLGLAFGSCSFREPIDELRALRLL